MALAVPRPGMKPNKTHQGPPGVLTTSKCHSKLSSESNLLVSVPYSSSFWSTHFPLQQLTIVLRSYSIGINPSNIMQFTRCEIMSTLSFPVDFTISDNLWNEFAFEHPKS